MFCIEKASVATVYKQEDVFSNKLAQLLMLDLLIIRQLSRHLVGLWTAENPIAMNLLKRILVRLQISSVQTFKQMFDARPIFMTQAISIMIVMQAKYSRM